MRNEGDATMEKRHTHQRHNLCSFKAFPVAHILLYSLLRSANMPTRILKENAAPSQASRRPRANPITITGIISAAEENTIRRTAADLGNSPPTSRRNSSVRSRSIGFRSSILRELRNLDETEKEEVLRLSADDIRASPRLMGYLFSMIASFVMLVSVLQ